MTDVVGTNRVVQRGWLRRLSGQGEICISTRRFFSPAAGRKFPEASVSRTSGCYSPSPRAVIFCVGYLLAAKTLRTAWARCSERVTFVWLSPRESV